MTKPIGILLVDDHAIVRLGYRALFGKQSDMRLLAEAADADQAYRLYQSLQPDIVVTDWSLPEQSGLHLISRIKQRDADARILVFSMHQNPAFAEAACRAGALGYVTKNSAPEILLQGIREIRQGRRFLSADIAQALALEKLQAAASPLQQLTGRELEIFRLLTSGRGTEQIAALLHLSQKTVANHHYAIKKKLGVTNDIELTHLALKWRLFDLPSEPKD